MSASPEYDLRATEKKDDEKADSYEDNKQVDTVSVQSIDSRDVDEALGLVGMRRTAEFSEEYNKKLRRKLVCQSAALHLPIVNHSTGLGHSSAMCSCLLHAISVSLLRHVLFDARQLILIYRDKNTLSYAR